MFRSRILPARTVGVIAVALVAAGANKRPNATTARIFPWAMIMVVIDVVGFAFAALKVKNFPTLAATILLFKH